MRKVRLFLGNRVILGMLLFLAGMAAWEFGVRPAYFPQALVEQDKR